MRIMSRLNRPEQLSTEDVSASFQEEDYIPQHPMLQYKATPDKKEDHLVNYQEVQPFEDAENIFGDMYRSAKKKVSKVVKAVKKKVRDRKEAKDSKKKAKETEETSTAEVEN